MCRTSLSHQCWNGERCAGAKAGPHLGESCRVFLQNRIDIDLIARMLRYGQNGKRLGSPRLHADYRSSASASYRAIFCVESRGKGRGVFDCVAVGRFAVQLVSANGDIGDGDLLVIAIVDTGRLRTRRRSGLHLAVARRTSGQRGKCRSKIIDGFAPRGRSDINVERGLNPVFMFELECVEVLGQRLGGFRQLMLLRFDTRRGLPRGYDSSTSNTDVAGCRTRRCTPRPRTVPGFGCRTSAGSTSPSSGARRRTRPPRCANTPLSIRDWFGRPSTGRTLRISLRCTAYNQRVSATEQLKERVSVEDRPAQHVGCENEELW